MEFYSLLNYIRKMSAAVGNEIIVCIACYEDIDPEDHRAIFEVDAPLCGDCVKDFHCRGCATNCEYKLEKRNGKRRCERCSSEEDEEVRPLQ